MLNSTISLKRDFLEKKGSIKNTLGHREILSRVFQTSKKTEEILKKDISFCPASWFWSEKSLSSEEQAFLNKWYYDQYIPGLEKYLKEKKAKNIDEYIEFGNYIFLGWALGMGAWKIFDMINYRNHTVLKGIVEGVVRYICGAGDTIGGAIGHHKIRKNKEEKIIKEETPKISSDIFKEMEERIQQAPGNIVINEFTKGSIVWGFSGPIAQAAIMGGNFDTSGPLGAIYASGYSNGDNLLWGLNALRGYIQKLWVKQGFREFFEDPFQRANIWVVGMLFLISLFIRSQANIVIDSLTLSAIEGSLLNFDSIISVANVRLYHRKMVNKLIKNTTSSKNLKEIANILSKISNTW